MKTAPTIPDSVTEEAEALAERLGISLSDFYTDALVAYCKRYSDRQQQRANLNQFYARSHRSSILSLPRCSLHLFPKRSGNAAGRNSVG